MASSAVVPPENVAPSKLVRSPEKVAPRKSALSPQNVAPAKQVSFPETDSLPHLNVASQVKRPPSR